MKVEAITVSVGYADFLAETLPINLPLLDNIVVITSKEDEETIEVCRSHSVHCILSDDHTRSGSFNKGRLIQRGFDQIAGDDWILHLDGDCVLPRKFRQMIDWAHLDPKTIYGADRQNVIGWDAWERFKKHVGGWDNHGHSCAWWWHPQFPMSSRWVSNLHGYCPIGCFQLFHGSEMTDRGYHRKKYLYHHGDAARSDVQFSLQWDRRFRQVLSEVVVLHLESEKAPLGSNWTGRTTKRFAPEVVRKPEPVHCPPSHPVHPPKPPIHHPEPPPRRHHPEPPPHRHHPEPPPHRHK